MKILSFGGNKALMKQKHVIHPVFMFYSSSSTSYWIVVNSKLGFSGQTKKFKKTNLFKEIAKNYNLI